MTQPGTSSSGLRTTQETPPGQSLARIGFWDFAVVSVQLALVLGVALFYRVELERGFGVVAWIILVGFVIHAWLPETARLPFFLILTLTAIGALLREDGIWLVLVGLGLIALCHVPIVWWGRLVLVVLAGLALAVVRIGWIDVGWGNTVIPILAAMFMFRIGLYLYDLKEDRSPARLSHRLAYFFMLPNVCFPLFPVVDYKTFLDSYYDTRAAAIYQKGVFWMLRGVCHLLLYRLIYYLMPSVEADVPGVLGVYAFMAMTFGLYLRVSGLFHLITGSLCLFGFNLPRTNNNYFLASSFNDLWRRINIYWKDFMMKLVFYPVFMGLRRLPMDVRLIASTVTVFAVTWFLHSYQWFWLQGSFPVTATDIAFWGFLGVALAINSIWEAHHRRGTLEKAEWSWGRALGLSGRVIAVFSIMAVVWGLWYSDSVNEWWYRIARVRESNVGEWLVFAGLILTAVIVGAVVQWLNARKWRFDPEQLVSRHSPIAVPSVSALLLLLGLPVVYLQAGSPGERLVSKLKSTEPNRIDLDRQERGYYETLSRSANTVSGGGLRDAAMGDVEVLFRHSTAVRSTTDIRGYEIVPGASLEFRGSTLQANRWGMRDRHYSRDKPEGIYRIALVGSSHVMGWGVDNEQTFENVVEERLNEEARPDSVPPVEILNFAVAGYALPQALYVARETIPAFEPDMVMVVIHPREAERLVKRLRILITGMKGEAGEGFEYIDDILEAADAHVGLPASEFERRLAPFRRTLLTSSLERLAAAVREQGAEPMLVLLPLTDEAFGQNEIADISRLGEDVGFQVLSLTDAYRGYSPERIRMTSSDNHPNPLGHELIADRLHAALLETPALRSGIQPAVQAGAAGGPVAPPTKEMGSIP
jgi:hypothetical protein